MTNRRTTTQSEQTAKQNLLTFMWIYTHCVPHYVKAAQTQTTVASLTGGIQECKTRRHCSFLALSGGISPVPICPSSSVSAGMCGAAYIIAEMNTRSFPYSILMKLTARPDLNVFPKERNERETFLFLEII